LQTITKKLEEASQQLKDTQTEVWNVQNREKRVERELLDAQREVKTLRKELEELLVQTGLEKQRIAAEMQAAFEEKEGITLKTEAKPIVIDLENLSSDVSKVAPEAQSKEDDDLLAKRQNFALEVVKLILN
jgi:hypothetical protein